MKKDNEGFSSKAKRIFWNIMGVIIGLMAIIYFFGFLKYFITTYWEFFWLW